MTKKDIEVLAKSYGCSTAYGGKTKTMYIHGECRYEFVNDWKQACYPIAIQTHEDNAAYE